MIGLKAMAVILNLWTLSGGVSEQDDDSKLRSQFLSGVDKSADALDRLSFQAKCSLRTETVSVSAKTREVLAGQKRDPPASESRNFEFAIRGRLGWLREIGRKIENVKVKNDSYAFSLSKPEGGAQYSLQFLEKQGANPKADAAITELNQDLRSSALSGYYLWETPLSQAVHSKDFHIHDVKSVAGDDQRELVRVEFDYQIENRPSPGFGLLYTDCFLVCDPSSEWKLVEYGGTCYVEINKSTADHHVLLDYGDSVRGVPVAKTVKHTVSFTSDPGTVIRTTRVIEIAEREGDVPREEFFLSFYGMPEPNFSSNGFRAWFGYLIAGAAFLIIGILIMRRRKSPG